MLVKSAFGCGGGLLGGAVGLLLGIVIAAYSIRGAENAGTESIVYIIFPPIGAVVGAVGGFVGGLRAAGVGDAEPDPGAALPDPGNLTSTQQQVGKRFVFKVTGAAGGSVWGTDVYTTESNLATAAVHAGVLRAGQSGLVRVKIVAPPASFTGSVRNGVTSQDYPTYPWAFQILLPRP
jgi:hypothetical protein